MKHSKITAIVLALCMLVTLMVVAPTAASATTDANLVTDGSFENWGANGDSAKGLWVTEAPKVGIYSDVVPVQTESSDGNWSLMLKGYKQVGEEETTDNSSRRAVSYNIGQFAEGTGLKISLKANVTTLTDGVLKLLVRFGTGEDAVTNNNQFGEVFPIQTLNAVTDGWVELSTISKIDASIASKDVVIWFESSKSTEFVAYIDDVKAEVVSDFVVNGDFECKADFYNSGAGWTDSDAHSDDPEVDAAQTVEIVTEDNNSYLKLSDKASGKTQVWVEQTISGLDATKQYRISLDVLSPHHGNQRWQNKDSSQDGSRETQSTIEGDFYGFAHVDGVPMFSELTTYGKWNSYYATFTNKASFKLRLMCYNYVNEEDAYVYFDNVVIEEVVSGDNILPNGSFDYGRNGLGVESGKYGITSDSIGFWKTGVNADYGNSVKYMQSTDSVDGKYSLKVNRLTSEENATMMNLAIPFEVGATYLFSAYVKNISLTPDSVVFFYSDVTTSTINMEFGTSKMPQGEWVCLQFIAKADKASARFDVRVPAGNATKTRKGEVLIDNVSIRKLDKAYATYTDAEGHYSASLVDGGKATITMPAAEGYAGNAVALAVYGEVDGKKILKSLKVKMITAEEVTAGHAQFTLTADKLNDFATENYTAKLMTMKNGTLVPLQDVVLYTEAQ